MTSHDDLEPDGITLSRHKQTGEVFAEAVATMTRLNSDAAEAAVAAGVRAATDVTGFGLLGHLYKMCRASGVVGAVIDRGAVPVIEGAREALRDGFISGGTRATSTGSGRICVPRPTSPRRTCCCSPTRRPPGVC